MESDAGSTVPRRQLGRYLRQLREKKGLSVKAVAEILECSFQKVWRIEKGSAPGSRNGRTIVVPGIRNVP